MKRLMTVALVVMAFGMTMQAQKINWMTMDEALAAQKKNPKKILVDVYTTWCGPCKLMDRNTFTNKDVANFINKNFYPVKFDAEGTEKVTYKNFTYTNPNYDPARKGKRNSQHFFAHAMKINAYPSLAFFSETGDFIQPIPGYKTPKQLEIFLRMLANDDYKQLTTQQAWQEYQANFKGTFNDS
ncbi:thioredoxin family protein [Croceiramulus getboli]|nr:thioredoxin family protein [Flavobacteriaceae bacterium YJPT1-3]